jgi:hypothetical protein
MLSRSIGQSRKLAKVSLKSALLYTWMIPFLDDYGHFEAETDTIKSEVVRYRSDFSARTITACLKELTEAKLIKMYEVDGLKYFEQVKFEDHQTFRSDRPRRADYPMPPWMDTSGIPSVYPGYDSREHLSDVSISKVKLREGEGESAQPGYQDTTGDDHIDAEGYLRPAYKAWEDWQGIIGGGPGGAAWELRQLVKDFDAEVQARGADGIEPGPIVVESAIRTLMEREKKSHKKTESPIRYLRAMIFRQLEEDIDGIHD